MDIHPKVCIYTNSKPVIRCFGIPGNHVDICHQEHAIPIELPAKRCEPATVHSDRFSGTNIQLCLHFFNKTDHVVLKP